MTFWLAALAALTALRLLLAAVLPLAPDEAYYWLWSRHLQAGYFDHPPMVALWIRAGTALAGNNPLGIRLLGPLSAALGSALLWRAGEDLLPGRRAGLTASLLLNATLMVGVGAIVMTPDTPLFCAWTAGIAALGRLLATGNPRWWLAVGAAAGLALLSKYTGLLFIAAVAGWLLTRHDGRAALRTAWPWAGLALAALLFAPNVWWNASHGWVSYFKQGGRAAQFDAGRAGQYLLELLGGQLGLATPIICGLGIAGMWRLWRLRRLPGPATPLLLWLSLLPGAVLAAHIVSGRVQANWPAIIYPAACLAAAGLAEPRLRRWRLPAAASGLALTALVYAQALAAAFPQALPAPFPQALPAPFPLAARSDPTALQLAGWGQLAAQVQAQAVRHHAAFIAADEYATAAEIAVHPGATPVLGPGFDLRWRDFGMAPALPGLAGIVVIRRTDTVCPVQLGTVARRRGDAVIAVFKICRFVAPVGSVYLPRP